MMKLRLRKKHVIRLLSAVLLICAAIFIWLNYQVEKRSGKYTEVVDPISYFQGYEIIGIKNVNILHPEADFFIPNQNVILKNGKIYDINNDDRMNSSIKYLDGTGKFLIPGFVDTHVHLGQSKNDLMLYLANGVTSIWEMFGDKTHLEWKTEKYNGGVSPEIFVATRKLGSQKGLSHRLEEFFGGEINYTTVEAVQKGIQGFKKEGYDAIKLGSNINPIIYDAIIAESKKQNIPVLGHLSKDIGLKNMYTSGISELAHIEEITKSMMNDFGGVGYNNTNQFLSYLSKNADSVAISLKENNIAVSSTIFLMESLPKQKFELDNYLRSIELKYTNPSFVEGSVISKGWLPGNNSYENLEVKNDPEKRSKLELWWNTYVDAIHIMTKALIENDVILLVGTDSNVTGVVPGFSLHKELASLVNAGLTNSEAIYAATRAPAKWANTDAGVIKIGSNADLLLLNANPIVDIANSNSIETVFTGNFYLLGKERKKLLEALIEFNDESRSISISKWK